MESGRRRWLRGGVVAGLAWAGGAWPARAAAVRLGPGDDLRRALRSGGAGLRLALLPGQYEQGLALHGVSGTRDAPIVIEAADPAHPPVFLARAGHNTVSLVDCAWVVLRHLVLDGRGLGVDAVKAEGHARFADFVTLQGLQILNHGADQSLVGVSTKCPAHGWVVRDCLIAGAGTGMYFGHSNGTAPFTGARLEGNRILRPTGYGIQIKHQVANPRPEAVGDTIIRGNLIIKGANSAREPMARPNLLIGHRPLAGTGADDRTLVTGNVLFGNPTEALLQAEGQLAIYGNLCVNPEGDALRVMAHNARPRRVAVFHNTVVARGLGLELSGGEAGYERSVLANLIYAAEPERGERAPAGANVLRGFDQAVRDLTAPLLEPPQLDASLRAGVALPAVPALPAALADLPHAREDLRGAARDAAFAGACLPTRTPERCG